MTMIRRSILALVTACSVCAYAAEPATSPADPLAAAIAQLRAEGKPATFEDLVAKRLPDEKNGAIEINKAVKLLQPEKFHGPSSSALEYGDELPYPPEWFKLAERNATAHAESASLLHAARMKGNVDWSISAESPEHLFRDLRDLTQQRELANTVGDIALLQHFKGEEQRAIQTLRDLEFLGDSLMQRPFLISKLVGQGILAKAQYTAHIIGANVTVGPQHDPTSAMLRQELKAAIDELLDDRKIIEGYRAAMSEERTLLINEIQKGQLANVPDARAQLPRSIAAYDAMADAIDKAPWETVDVGGGVGLEQVIPSVDRFRKTSWRLITLRRMAAVSLAMGMYKNDHGKYPDDLQALVPEYLPTLPKDPLARDGAALRYAIVADGKRPMIGSVGDDGQPSPPGLRNRTSYGPYFAKGEPDDMWLDLSDWKPL